MNTKNLIGIWLLFFSLNSQSVLADIPSPIAVAFTHGVASGDVHHDRAILWTRVNRKAIVRTQLASDAAFENIILSSSRLADANDDFTINFIAHDLQPDQTYYYRFTSETAVSTTGTFRTAPDPGQGADMKFAFTADSDGTHIDGVPFFNNFEILDAVRLENPDFFVYLGDTIYSDSMIKLLVLGQPPAATVDEYRAAYKENRTIAALPDLLKSTSTIAVWDDHEVRNDYSGQTVDPVLYANGRQAFLEYFPVELPQIRQSSECADKPLLREFKWGKDVDIIVLDERSCRSASVEVVCQGDLGPTLPSFIREQFAALGVPMTTEPPAGCLAAMYDPDRTMLGRAQKARLKAALKGSTAKYKLIINEVPIQQFFALPYDRWEGFAAERNEILNFIRDNAIENVIFLTTDMHTNMMNDVAIDLFTDPAPISYELITGPIATFTFESEVFQLLGPGGVYALHQVLNIAGVDCRNTNINSYGLVEFSSETGKLKVSLKDNTGSPVVDQFNPAIQCSKLF